MPTWPYQGFFNGPVIHPWTVDATLLGNTLVNLTIPSTAGVIDQNVAYYAPFVILNEAYVARRMFIANGATGTGNVDVGIYDRMGNRIVSMGSTAKTAAAAIQFLDIADTTLQPGQYWMAMASNSATDTFNRGTTQSFITMRGMYVRQQATAFPLPDPAVFAVPTLSTFPVFGLTNRTF